MKKSLAKLSLIGFSLFFLSLGIYYVFTQPEEVESPSWNPDNTNPVGIEYNSTSGIYHLWNERDDYYVDATSGIQITNHYQEYWSKNLVCIRILTNKGWEEFCADALTWNWETSSDNSTYANLTGTTSLQSGGYKADVTLEYYLKSGWTTIKITPTFKNTGLNVDDSEFVWKAHDIRVNMTEENDFLELNLTTGLQSWNLSNSSLNLSFNETDLAERVYYLNEYPDSYPNYWIIAKWNESLWKNGVPQSLNYDLDVIHDSEYNAPVVLTLKTGAVAKGDVVYSNFRWHDKTRYVDTCVLSLPDSDPDGYSGDAFTQTCYYTEAGSGPPASASLYAQYNSTTQGWANMPGTDGLSTADTNPVTGVKDLTNVSWTVDENTADTYYVRCWCYDENNPTQSKYSGVQKVTVKAYYPQWSNPTVNDSDVFENEPVNHTADWSIVGGNTMSGFIFSWNSSNGCDGTWVNSSWTSFPTSNQSSNVSILTTGCSGKTVGWRFFANASNDEWNVTDVQTYDVLLDYPQYHTPIGTNDTDVLEGDAVKHYMNWTNPAQALDGFVFSTNVSQTDCSVGWDNATWEAFPSGGMMDWSNYTWTLPPDCGSDVGWKIYANNTQGRWNVSSQQNYSVSVYGYLEVDWTTGSEINSTECSESSPCSWSENTIKTANATVTCRDGSCGTVTGKIYYNDSATTWKLINGTYGAFPLFINETSSDFYTPRKCTDTWEQSCDLSILNDAFNSSWNGTHNLGCNGTEIEGLGSGQDVQEVYLNATSVKFGDAINATCQFEVGQYLGKYSTTWMFYYNGSEGGWMTLGNWTDTEASLTVKNHSVVFKPNNTEGTHYIRCTLRQNVAPKNFCASWTGEADYGIRDNDDVNFTVTNQTYGDNMKSLGTLNKDQTAQVNFTINMTDNSSSRKIHINFTSSYSQVSENDTDDAVFGAAVDTTPPTYSLNSTNSTIAGTPVEHRLKWTDDTGLSGYIFQFCNGTWDGSSCVGGSATETNGTYLIHDSAYDLSPFFPNLRTICRDGQGNIHTTWQNESNTVVYANSSDDGVTWNVNIDVNSTGSKGNPSISCDGNNISVAYKGTVYLSTDNGGSWSDISSPYSGTYVQVEIRGQRVYLGYDDNFTYSTDQGSTWQPTKKVIEGSYSSMAVNGSGLSTDTIHIVSKTGSDSVNYTRSTDGGATFSDGITPISGTSNGINHESITVDGSNVYLVAETLTSGIIWFTNSTDGGVTWTTNYTIPNSSVVAKDVSVTIDNNGYPWVFYWQSAGTDAGYVDKFDGTSWSNYTLYTTNAKMPSAKYNYNNNRIEYMYQNDTALYDYPIVYGYFEFTDGGGGWTNDTWVEMTGTGNWSNVTKIINSTVGANIAWCVYANDTFDNWNSTSCDAPFTYITTSAVIDATFSIAMPSDYTSWSPISGTTEGEATSVDWISFNFSDIPENFRQPYQMGDSSTNQSGVEKPIFFIDVTGNTDIDISLRFSSSPPSGIAVGGNSSCSGTYTSCQSSLQGIQTSYVLLIDNLSQTDSYGNITLYANVSSGTSPTGTGYTLYIKGAD